MLDFSGTILTTTAIAVILIAIASSLPVQPTITPKR